jgi:hypothetical protein
MPDPKGHTQSSNPIPQVKLQKSSALTKISDPIA